MTAALPLSITACGAPPEAAFQFDSARVVQEVDSVMDLLRLHMERLEFDLYTEYYAAPEIVTVAKELDSTQPGIPT